MPGVESAAARTRALGGAALCALAAHSAVYRSLWPDDGAHGYYGWYESTLAVFSAAALLSFAALVALAALARRGLLCHACARLSPLLNTSTSGSALALQGARLARAGLVIFVAQESLERTLAERQPALALFSASELLTAITAIGVFALALVAIGRCCRALARQVLREGRAQRVDLAQPPSRRLEIVVQRRSPLATRAALRAPPLSIG